MIVIDGVELDTMEAGWTVNSTDYRPQENAMQQIDHPVFGSLEMTHDVPEINMHWWEGAVVFPPTSTRVLLDIHASPTGPNDIQTRAYTKLLENYSRVFETGRRKRDVPVNCADNMLEKITFFVHGHMDLFYKATGAESRIYADQDAAYISPDVAMEN